MSKKIKTTIDQHKNEHFPEKAIIGGWLDGKEGTYLWLGDSDNKCIGTLSGNRLYRLAKAIVKQFED